MENLADERLEIFAQINRHVFWGEKNRTVLTITSSCFSQKTSNFSSFVCKTYDQWTPSEEIQR